jgi:hypothetical protein
LLWGKISGSFWFVFPWWPRGCWTYL